MIYYTDKLRVPFQINKGDYRAVSRYRWYMDGHYVATRVGTGRGGRKVRLHEFLMGKAPDGLEWDHKNRDKADNRRRNLRAVTRTINVRNTGMRRNNRSGVKGVAWDKKRGAWEAYINQGVKKNSLGFYSSLHVAARKRRAAERELWAA